MLDGIVKEACRIVGGAPTLASLLGISKQAIDSWSKWGIPEEHLAALEKLTKIPRTQFRAYTRTKQKERHALTIEPREPRSPPEPPSPEYIRAQWHMHNAYPLWRGDPPPYPRPPECPAPTPLPDEVQAIIASFKSQLNQATDTRILLEMAAKCLRAGHPWHVRFDATLTPRLRGIVGCWSAPERSLPYFRQIAQHYGAAERQIDNATVFFPRPVETSTAPGEVGAEEYQTDGDHLSKPTSV
jgi:DNA-binding transcriptional regulator YdaS (Cro superfamily)